MRSLQIASIMLAGALAACASVPTLRGSPESVADAIGANAVAYNQAYGRAIADQVLLNVLRARDRMPLYHLSMSGIQDNSELAQQFGQLTIGSVSLGDGNGGVGEWVGNRTLTTKPMYTLNPFSSGENQQARQFEPVSHELFQHYWDNNWSLEILLMVMAERLEVGSQRIENRDGGYRGDCGSRPDAEALAAERARVEREAPATLPRFDARVGDRHNRCNFVWTVQELSNGARPTLTATPCPAAEPSGDEATAQPTAGAAPAAAEEGEDEVSDRPPPICQIDLVAGGVTHKVLLRSIDDMLYFVGAIIRDYQGDASNSMTARVSVRPTNVYPADGEEWSEIARTAPLFQIVEVERPQRGGYAAEVVYRGTRFAAGPATSTVCVGVDTCDGISGSHNDASSRVLSLLTQIVILTQSEEAQLAPRAIIVP